MAVEIKIPSPGESISEVELASWFVEDGSLVHKNQEVGEIESEKATLPLIAEKAGRIRLMAAAGDTVRVGTVVAQIDTSVDVPQSTGDDSPAAETKPAPSVPAPPVEEPAPAARIKSTPLARTMMEKEGVSIDDVIQGLRKLNAGDVSRALKSDDKSNPEKAIRTETRKKMSQLRKKISERLVSVKNETAMLTTFNEVDMSAIMDLRKVYQDEFVKKHGIKLGFMSFFAKAVGLALMRYPAVNSYIEGEEVVSPDFCDIGIAVQTDKGLMVPVLRNVESLGLAQIEAGIADLAGKARKARLSIEDMTGGTFTISNGGIYGSMLSTPILNPPQSGILGMHNIQDRPVAVKGQVVIRPMMYLALSYDHRVIDGKDSVSFLKAVKEYLEAPVGMLFGSRSAEQSLLDL